MSEQQQMPETTQQEQQPQQQQQEQQQGRGFNIKDFVSFFMPKSLREEEGVEEEDQPKDQPSQPEGSQPEQATGQEEEYMDIPELELPEQREVPKDLDVLKQEAQFIAQQSNLIFKQMTGKDYDPLTATLEEQELFNRVREYVSDQLRQYREQEARLQRLTEFEQRFMQTEPKWKELVEYITNEKPAKVLLEIQQAIAEADVEKLNKMLTELRKEFYARQSKQPPQPQKTTEETPEPPFMERAGTEPPIPKPEFDPRQLRKASTFEERVKMIPLDILVPKHIFEQ